MSRERAVEHLRKFGLEDRIHDLPASSATVELAAAAVGVSPAEIAKTISFYLDGGVALIVTAGDTKIDNHKFKEKFGVKAKMLRAEDAEPLTGHAVGGVCPFGVNEGVRVFLDVSLKRFDIVYPAAGTSSNMAKLTCDELFMASCAEEWIDVCK